jgi:hypothetical protein
LNGSLWYGDLPALDGARDEAHSLRSLSEHERRPKHPECPGLRVGVGCSQAVGLDHADE